jgi:aerobic-type carbon monoxide dehydrogenase small subunit (CoxS/CutS family)
VTQNRVSVQFTLNGKKAVADILPEQSALQVIRDELGMKGTKEGCGIGECGACTIEVDGRSVNACLMFGVHLDGCRVMTVEGLAQDGRLHPIQESFLAGHAVQCGFCTPGLLMSTHSLLEENPEPDEQQIVQAISGNICRCTGYQQIFSSVRAACGQSGQGKGPESENISRERC